MTEQWSLQLAAYWNSQISAAQKNERTYQDKVEKIISRYRDERNQDEQSTKLNILWSNVETLKPALYSASPKPQIERRYKDDDPMARQAAQVLERAIRTSMDQNDFDSVLRAAVQDLLLAGRGVARIRYEPSIVQLDDEEQTIESGIEFTVEKVCVDYVYWSDFLCSPARNWNEVSWVAFRNYLSTDQMLSRFNVDAINQFLSDYKSGEGDYSSHDTKKIVWEIWDKEERKVIWLAQRGDGSGAQLLDVQDDPLQLKGFFPCPMPMFTTLTNDQLLPVPDYILYQDQAIELDVLTARISNLARLIRLRGVYDSAAEPLQRLMSEYGADSQLIPVDQWASLTQKGGLDGVVAWMPIERMVQVLSQLYQARERVKQDLYEITGIADIIRGSTVASETATAQQIKGRFATLRLGERQKEVARFSRDLIRLQAEVMAEHFDLSTLQDMSGLSVTPQMMDLFRSDRMRQWKIDIETDSTISLDEASDKSARIEFLTAITGFIKEVAPMVQVGAVPISLAKEMLLFGVRGFRIARELEAAMESIPSEPPAGINF